MSAQGKTDRACVPFRRGFLAVSLAAGGAPGGIGEPGCAAGPPSLVNAIAAAAGIRLRQLPVDRRILAGRGAA
jgi:hypothetical protein